MKKRISLISLEVALTLMVLLGSCSTQKQEYGNEEAENLETNSKKAEYTKPAIQAFQGVDAKVKTQINGFLMDYFALNQMLITDNQNGAKSAAKKLSETMNKFDMANLTGEQMDFYLTQVSKLNEGLNGIRESTDIEKTRIVLATVSEIMYAVVKAYHPNESKLYYQFCPMARNGAGANWISGTKDIVNPYMGQSMPECGRTEETLP